MSVVFIQSRKVIMYKWLLQRTDRYMTKGGDKPGEAAATKRWRDLINIHDLDCNTKTVVSGQQVSKTVRD